MAGYSVFARYYDALTGNVEYGRRAEYLLALLKRLGHEPGLTLDLACGTGSLTLELFRRGVDVYGVDASVEMLSEAREKCAGAGADVLFLCQRMQSLDLFGTVDTVVCTLDSLNHLQGRDELRAAFSRVSLFLNGGGYFLFDMNTPYKHEKILGNHTFVYDREEVFCVWQNRYSPRSCKVDIQLDFFERDGNAYLRSGEHFSEYAYPAEELQKLLEETGFGEVAFYEELTFEPLRPESQRLVCTAKKVR